VGLKPKKFLVCRKGRFAEASSVKKGRSRPTNNAFK